MSALATSTIEGTLLLKEAREVFYIPLMEKNI
jgi:hypothetical protein